MAQDLTTANPLRLAVVTGGLHLGGTTTFVCNLAGELLRRNRPATVLSLTRGHPLAPDFARANIPVHREDETRHIFEDRMQSVLRRLAEFQPTVVVANISPSSFEVLRYVPPGVCRVGMIQSDDAGWYRTMQIYHAHFDLIAAVSEKIQAQLRAQPEFSRTPVAYLPYGVPMPEHVAAGPGDAAQPLRILYLGRLDQEQKRVRLFPTILAQLRAAGIPFEWTIAGTGPERDYLEQTMSAAPQQTVTFPGHVAYADVPRLLAAHDIFLLASDYEGLPLSLLEAMGHGLVPVVSDLPSGIRTVVDETNGIRVPLEQTAGYAAAIVHLHHHRAELSALSRRAAAKVREEYSVRAMANRWLAILPQRPVSDIVWPKRFSLRPILGVPQPWRFSPPVRSLRRLLLKLNGAARGGE